MQIDLGSEISINVKYAGKDYSLREPTVQECSSLKGKSEVDALEAMVNFLDDLGMPKEVTMKMGLSKVTKLVDGLTDMLTKKK